MRTGRSTHSSRASLVVATVVCAVATPMLLIGCSSDGGTETTSGSNTVTTLAAPDPTAAPTSSTSSTSSTSTTTTEPYVMVGAIVMVANCSTKNGAAGALTSDLAAFGFTMGLPTNGFGPDSDLATSKIYAKPGSEEVANSLSRLLDGIPVLRMPTPAWVTGGTEAIGETSILVMLGNDLAGQRLGEIAAD